MTAPDQYRLVFDIAQQGYKWWFPACGLGIIAIGFVFHQLGKLGILRRPGRLFPYFFFGFACFWTIVVFVSTGSEYRRIRSAYRDGHYKVVEGVVTNFQPMPYSGHQDECFTVELQTFCYSDYSVTPGFNNTASHGGPIYEGLPVRVAYVGNVIVRLEVDDGN
ncbi:MAG TPA: hypothetical protein VKB38_20490 [Terracidiphilus sp.]|nr:hypothetical protein [Terracidiphilus sp.]